MLSVERGLILWERRMSLFMGLMILLLLVIRMRIIRIRGVFGGWIIRGEGEYD
jgi:hypothetical protein